MLGEPTESSNPTVSLYYLLMAEACFCRAVNSQHPNVVGELRNRGRKYLGKASCGTQVSMFSSARAQFASAQASV